MTTKRAWRAWAAAIQRTPTTHETAEVVNHLVAHLTDRPDDSLFLTFNAMSHEIDLSGLVARIGPSRFATTRTPAEGPLTVHSYDGPTERHRYGFDQPAADAPTIDPAAIDVVLLPGVLFGADGTRLGHGMGYYDRLLALCRPGIERIAVTTSSLVTSTLPTDSHDVTMTHIATEVGLTPIAW
ncbi:MAG: 5-formyltetrahydrofolate cyclo-ligase [Actinomycetota bacterium]|nr:5-formyltetrahydrofolate cyclo-ligase [Actinomycetota bacterium]